ALAICESVRDFPLANEGGGAPVGAALSQALRKPAWRCGPRHAGRLLSETPRLPALHRGTCRSGPRLTDGLRRPLSRLPGGLFAPGRSPKPPACELAKPACRNRIPLHFQKRLMKASLKNVIGIRSYKKE